MKINVSMCRAAYELLRSSPPFSHWRLPRTEEVEFLVARIPEYGTFEPPARVTISDRKNGRLATLLHTMAHEMAHLKMQRDGASFDYTHRHPTWRKLITDICNHHGFDPKCL